MADSTFPHHGEAERWLPVVGWEGRYEVSDLGRVWSSLRRTSKGMRGGCVLKPMLGKNGYLKVELYRPGLGRQTQYVHRLVLAAFVGPLPPGMESRHGPAGALDNRLTNLCYGTQSENMDDRVRDGTMLRGEQTHNAILTAAIVADCQRRYAAGETQASLAREFKVSVAGLNQAMNGKTWAHLAAAEVRPRTYLAGEANAQAKLTWESVAEIRRRYAAGEMQTPLGAEFGVSQAVISRIVLGKAWKRAA